MEFVSKHKGHNYGKSIRNSYEIWKENDGKLIVKMEVLQKKITKITMFDHKFLSKIKNDSKTWYVNSGGYVARSTPFKYLHHLVMDFEGRGRGFQDYSVDHINRITLDNRIENLRLATCQEQKSNSKGQIKGTKRARKTNAQTLPNDVNENDIPKYVVYYTETYGKNRNFRNFFRIEKHPGQLLNPPLLKNKWATSKSMKKLTITDKLKQASEKVKELDKLYETHIHI